MHSLLLLTVLSGLAASAPTPFPQNFHTDNTVPDIGYDVTPPTKSAVPHITSPQVPDAESTNGALEMTKRAASCPVQPKGAGPRPSPDSPSAFASFSAFAAAAHEAVTPTGYTQMFRNFQGATSADKYLGYTSLGSYDVAGCASQCDAKTGCKSFNIYYERDPTVEPGPGCEDPSSTTMIKCSLWGSQANRDNAVNTGEQQLGFEVVIAGSNGYTKGTVSLLQSTILRWTLDMLP